MWTSSAKLVACSACGEQAGIHFPPRAVSAHLLKMRNVCCMASNDDGRRSCSSVAIVGAGVSGLAAAYKLKCQGLSVTLFEADDRAGGKIRSVTQDGLIWEEGANTMTESEEAVRVLIDSLGLRQTRQSPVLQNKRYIVKNGMPQLVPSNPSALVMSSLLSTESKLRLFMEPLLWRAHPKHVLRSINDGNAVESVGDFFHRHFGKEVVDYIIDPIVVGTSAGDPYSVSMCHTFPEIWHLEKKFGSIILGAVWSMFSRMKERKGKKKTNIKGSFSFQGGMQTLTDRLCEAIGSENVRLASKVLTLSYCPVASSLDHAWSITHATKDAHGVVGQDHSFDAVIMTAPLHNVKEMKIRKAGHLFGLNFLPEVAYLPVSVIITSFKKEVVEHPLQGFGVLIPSKELDSGLKTLGTLFSSMMFPDRAPSDHYLYTTFVGGNRNRDLAQAALNELLPIVTSDLNKLLGVVGQPTFAKHIYWDKAFPLYGQDHDLVLQAICMMEENLPGFFYAGNLRDGLSVGKTIASGYRAAEQVISYLSSSEKRVVFSASRDK